MAIRLFQEAAHASIYRQYRPAYPQKVLEIITNYVKKWSGGYDVAVDVACGSGQSTFYLQNTFRRCIGVDISKAQVKEASQACQEKGLPNIEFVQGSAADIPMEASSVDVVTIAQAWHWVDPESFYAECKRILKPGGCLAVYGYGNGQIINNTECNVLLKDFYTKTLKGYWNDRRRHIDNEFKEVVLPFSNTERHYTSMLHITSLDWFIGYVSTWSGYCKYCEENPGNKELQVMEEKMRQVLVKEKQSEDVSTSNEDGLDLSVQVRFPVFVLLGQK